MTPEKILLAVVTVSWSGWMLSFAIGKWVRGQESSTQTPIYRIDQLEKAVARMGDMTTVIWRVEQLEHAMDRAGQRWSDLADDVQTMPDKLASKFITRNECEMLVRGPRRHTDETS